ncbi:MAG: efflux RND transporter periplasmic adaptor subunit [Thermoanaerobaculaceae bacterium]|jgi:multidrug efflux pump subunit AcrA (membrane-fusion protein)|nr:efflux RND transporter periplasmic adaptor subunit [Thermoanaerobaculaceae bacterium]
MKKLRPVLLACAVFAVIAVLALTVGCGKTAQHAERYHCPMHPTYVADRPGDCPICGMRLVPIEERAAPTTVPAYTCPMHPEVTSDNPASCPECGMKLVATGARGQGSGASAPTQPVDHPAGEPGRARLDRTPDPGPRTPGSARTILFYRNPMDPTVTSPVPARDPMGMDYVPVYSEQDPAAAAAGIPGNASVEITADGIRLAGVQTAPAVIGRLTRTVRAVGTVTADETRIRHVHTKIPGWVEKLFVNFTGQAVRKGEPILSIYSQELLASQEELLRARETAARFSSSTLPEVRKGGDDLARAARRRLELFDVPEVFIAELERTGTVQRTVTLKAPVSGFVTMKDVFEGHQVEPARELFTITDLSRVWVEAEVYEYEAGSLRLGEAAAVTLPYDAATRLEGRIAFISPTLDANTRTLKVRLEFPNPGTALKPGMFATVELAIQAGDGIVVPDSALLDTGERQVVFVSVGEGVFEPRVVTVGVRSGGKAQVLSGVAAGEQVVIRANFLLDSESRLRAALAAPPPTPGSGVRSPGSGEASHAH